MLFLRSLRCAPGPLEALNSRVPPPQDRMGLKYEGKNVMHALQNAVCFWVTGAKQIAAYSEGRHGIRSSAGG